MSLGFRTFTQKAFPGFLVSARHGTGLGHDKGQATLRAHSGKATAVETILVNVSERCCAKDLIESSEQVQRSKCLILAFQSLGKYVSLV